ncbi:MAG: CBS domain-containing protein [Candidatus Micrarchaeia archaeon]
MEDLAQIKELRRRLGMTQHRLAAISGVSQSLIAKIESGRVDPAYSKAKSILSALQRERFSSEKKASDIMHAGVETIPADETLHGAAALMRKKGISQMPISDGKRIVGSITEQTIVANFTGEQKKLANLRVREVMEDAFPTALPATPVSAIASLLHHYPAVLVMDKGEIAGIITKADLLKTI